MANPSDVELRGQVPRRLMELIDALQQADGHSSRMEWVIPVLEREVNARVHGATLLLRIAGINPLAREPSGKDADA